METALKPMKIVATLLALLVIGGAASYVHARGGCRQFFAQQAYVAQPYIAQPVVLYQAGVQVEQDALAERIAQRVEAKILQRLIAAPKHQSAVQAPGSQSVEAPPAPTLAMEQHCASCHSGPKPKGGVVFDGVTPLECFHVTKALRMIRDEKMPKDHRLTPEQKGQIMEELLNLERQDTQDTLPAAPAEVPKE
jgi:hypothetical protein